MAARLSTFWPLRFGVSLIGGLVVVSVLYFVLATLIEFNNAAPGNAVTLPAIRFTHTQHKLKVQTRQHKPPKMPKKVKAAPEVHTRHVRVKGPSADVDIGVMKVNNKVAKNTGFSLSASDGNYLPIVKVAPMYPPRARSQGVEGYVLLEFTVTETGTVTNVHVLESHPKGVFDKAATKAVKRFKYKPRIQNGKPVRVTGVKQMITFKLNDK